MNKRSFFTRVLEVVGDLAYQVHGRVGLGLSHDKENEVMEILIYNQPMGVIEGLSDEDKEKSVIVKKKINLDDVDFSEEYTMSKKIDETLSIMRMCIHGG